MELHYLTQECSLTLREGLVEYYSVDTSYKKNSELVPAFYNHDIAHVLFGLSTKVEHESLVDTRVIFGTNWGLKKYFNDYFRNPNAIEILKKIFKEIGYIKGILLSPGPWQQSGHVIKDTLDILSIPCITISLGENAAVLKGIKNIEEANIYKSSEEALTYLAETI